MKINVLFGGQAGQGPNILTNVLGEALVKRGFYVFYGRDYQSLIRGGHNFNVLTFSDEPVYSNDSTYDIILALDENTEKIHIKELKEGGEIIKGRKENMYFAGRLFKVFCLDFSVLDEQLKRLKKRYEENVKEAKEGYDDEKREVCRVTFGKNKNAAFMNGNRGIAEGATKAGLDVYYAYPMTPATNVSGELAEKQVEKNILVLELENEISVINTAIGSSVTGAKAMIGTSGGGFDLMTEALSLTGMAEVPLVIYLCSRPGPSTGVATYTGQGDLDMARHSGHGEFPRMILSPGDPNEAQELTSQAFYFSQKFGVPVIVLADKHLAESFYTIGNKVKITPSKKITSLKRYNSYESDEFGNSTEDSEMIKKRVEARLKKAEDIKKEAEKFEQYKVYGKDSRNIIISFGSTKGAILDAMRESSHNDLKKSSEGAILDSINGLDVKFLQVLYLEPFSLKIKKELEEKNIILIENDATGQLGKLISEKFGVFIEDKNKILRYDGRPFLADELREEIRRRLK